MVLRLRASFLRAPELAALKRDFEFPERNHPANLQRGDIQLSIDVTHDLSAASWLESANQDDSPFPLQNLPFCRFSPKSAPQEVHIGVALGDQLVDLTVAQTLGLLQSPFPAAGRLQDLVGHTSSLRRQVFSAMLAGGPWRKHAHSILTPQTEASLLLPFDVGDYTDFYASIHHATRVGSMFRPDNPLLPNYKHIPIGYHGRASTIVASGAPIHRPSGQLKADTEEMPQFAPCKMLDYELEVGFWVGQGNRPGHDIPISQARSHLLGLCLVNDWSARDIQRWEYQPLGPFLAKSFATSVSPWVVTLEALEPFRCPLAPRPHGDPPVLPYLFDASDQSQGMFDITLEVYLTTSTMRAHNISAQRLSSSNLNDLYWSPAQLLAHHASNGCAMRGGDLLASGTVSGPRSESAGCLLELTWQGPGQPRRPVILPTGEERTFLQSGDEVIMTGWCRRVGFRSIGLGECRGAVL